MRKKETGYNQYGDSLKNATEIMSELIVDILTHFQRRQEEFLERW